MTGDDPFARQRTVEDWQQGLLTEATIIVIGVGALGNEVAKNLALAGVGRLVLCDHDVVEVPNLSRSVLFRSDDVDRFKVEVAAEALARLGHGIVVDPRPAPLASGVGLGELADADVVVGCLDSLRSRLELLGRAALAGARLVDGGTGPWTGEIRVRSGAESGCYGCTLTPYERGVSDLPRSCAELEPGAPASASIVTTAAVAAWMTAAVLRLAMGLQITYQALRLDAVAGTVGPVEFRRDPECPFHDRLPSVDAQLEVSSGDRVSCLLAALGPVAEITAWVPFPIAAQCIRCGVGSGYHYLQIEGEVSRCAHCGGVLRPRSSVDLSAAEPAAFLNALGVAPHEILRVLSVDGRSRWVRLAG
jgi:molybdopterin-synthase adenylyltransferase